MISSAFVYLYCMYYSSSSLYMLLYTKTQGTLYMYPARAVSGVMEATPCRRAKRAHARARLSERISAYFCALLAFGDSALGWLLGRIYACLSGAS